MAESEEILRWLHELEQRLRMVERRLAMRNVVERAEPEDFGALPALPEQAPFVAQAETSVASPAPTSGVASPSRTVAPPAPPVRLAVPPPRPSPAAKTSLDLERAIGARWFAAIGAVVVVIGVGLFVKLAYQKGWLNQISPTGRCISGATFGAMLLVVGEVLRRRIGALASAGPSAAGIGALFASAYASYGLYHLTRPSVAFAMIAATAVLGFFVAARGRLISIAVISLVAAYVNPLVVGEPFAGPLVVPVYIFALLCTGLALSAWRDVPFRLLRGLSWWGTLIYGTWWCSNTGLSYPMASLAFIAGVWIAVHTELVLSARGSSLADGDTLPTGELLWNRVRFIATSFGTTAWSPTLAVYVVREATRLSDWWPPAVLAVAASALAIWLAGDLRVLRDPPRADPERLGAGLAMQAGALIIATLALALSGWMEVVGWLSLGVAAVGAGRWIRSRGLEVYGIVVLSIASMRLVTYDAPW